jgi:ketosteroid isomerase-like protein
MYHAFVRHKLTQAFAGLSAGRIEAITNELADHAEHYFIGNHALSGSRHTPEAIHRWYERLLRLLPDIRFDLHRIHVQGFPWSTLAVVEWTETNSGTDGVETSNEGANVIRLAWGKVVSVRIYTNTAGLESTLSRLAAAGVSEAKAAPIVS